MRPEWRDQLIPSQSGILPMIRSQLACISKRSTVPSCFTLSCMGFVGSRAMYFWDDGYPPRGWGHRATRGQHSTSKESTPVRYRYRISLFPAHPPQCPQAGERGWYYWGLVRPRGPTCVPLFFLKLSTMSKNTASPSVRENNSMENAVTVAASPFCCGTHAAAVVMKNTKLVETQQSSG